jgi:AraC family transcriptional regulator
VHRYGGTDLVRRERRWPGVAVDRVRWHAPAGTTGEICKGEHQLFVSVAGSAGRLRARAADGSRYTGCSFPGAVTFVPAGCHRFAQYEGGTLDYIGIRIRPEACPRGVPAGGLRPFTNRPDPLVHRLALALDANQDGPAGSLFAESAAALLLAHLHRAGGGDDGDAPPRPSRRAIRQVVDHIEAHLHSALRISELAEVAGLEPHHFRRAFKAATGLPPHRYVTERRLARAAELLRDPNGPPIADVAARVGFSSQSHLTTAFGRQYGLTPAAYRAAHR